MKNMFKKLKNQKGESIAETLVALLVSVFGITILALMIQTASKLVTSSNIKMQEYVQKENELNEKTDMSDVGQLSLTKPDGTVVRFNKDEGPNIEIYYYELDLGSKKVVAYKKK